MGLQWDRGGTVLTTTEVHLRVPRTLDAAAKEMAQRYMVQRTDVYRRAILIYLREYGGWEPTGELP